MSEKLKATGPLALAVGILAFLYVEFTANFSFHWVTSGDLGNGLSLPAHFHFAVPIGFITWGLFFSLGAHNAAAKELFVNSIVAALGALFLFWFAKTVKTIPDFWGISLGVAIAAFVIVLLSGTFTWMNVPVIFAAFAGIVLWWFATGADGWAPGAVGHSVKALAKPTTAGQGAFGGVLSTPYGWVVISGFATLCLGIIWGLISIRFTELLTPGSWAEREAKTEAADERVATA